MSAEHTPPNPLLALIGLGQKARQAVTQDELGFLLVNDSKALSGYRQALLWWAERGVTHLSGVVMPERHSPFMQWASTLCKHLVGQPELAFKVLSVHDIPAAMQEGWGRWMPAQAWWIPVQSASEKHAGLLVADDALNDQHLPLWQEWAAVWSHAADRLERTESTNLTSVLRRWVKHTGQKRTIWYSSPGLWVALALVGVLSLPVPLTIVGQGEFVPRMPVVVRAPLDGVINEFMVAPNQVVQAGDALFSYDNDVVRSRLHVAQQNLAAAQAEYRQAAQAALSDVRARFQIAGLLGKVQEKRSEVRFLAEQVGRTTVIAPQAGMVLFDEASEWIGKPVQTGERVVRIADPSDVELEVWVNLADAVPLKAGDAVRFFMASSPLESMEAHVRWVGYEAQPRPDGTFAYRVRATLTVMPNAMVGAKGTARVSAQPVALAYWLLRKPLSVLRGYLLL